MEEPPFHPGDIAILKTALFPTRSGSRKGCPILPAGTELEILSEMFIVAGQLGYYFKQANSTSRNNTVFHFRLKRKNGFEPGSWEDLNSIWNPLKQDELA